MRHLRIAPLLLLLALTACGKETEKSTAPAPDVALNFSQPIDAHGADPAWTLKVRGTKLTLSQPGLPDVTANAPGATITAYSSIWTAPMANGATMKVSLYASPCIGAADGRSWPMAAEVAVTGASPLGGCAGPAGS